MNLLHYIRMILWAFFGVRGRAGAAAEFAAVRPVQLVLTAIAVAGCLVAVLISLAMFAVGHFG